MVAAYEFMVNNPGIANLIRENKTFRIDSSIQTGKKFGMQLLDDHLLDLYNAGKISAEEAVDKARRPADLAERMGVARKLNRPDLDKEGSDKPGGTTGGKAA
jgi:twitching motility protein PilT